MWCKRNLMLTCVLLVFLLQLFCPFIEAIYCYTCDVVGDRCDNNKKEDWDVHECEEGATVCKTASFGRLCGQTDEKINASDPTRCEDNPWDLCCTPPANAVGDDEFCNSVDAPAETPRIICYDCHAEVSGCTDPNELEGDKDDCQRGATVCKTTASGRFCGERNETISATDPTRCEGGDEYTLCCPGVLGAKYEDDACNKQELPPPKPPPPPKPFHCLECTRGQMGCHNNKLSNKFSKLCPDDKVCRMTADERICGEDDKNGCKDDHCNANKFSRKIWCVQCSIDADNPNAEDEGCRTGTLDRIECEHNHSSVCRAFGHMRQCGDDGVLAGDENACVWDDFNMPYDGVCCVEGDDACNKLPILGLPEIKITKTPLPPMECYKCKKPDNQTFCADGTTEVVKCKDGVNSCFIKDGKWACAENGVSCVNRDGLCCRGTRCNLNHYCYYCKGDKRIGEESRCEKSANLTKCDVNVKTCKMFGDFWECDFSEERCGNMDDFCCDSSKCNVIPSSQELEAAGGKKNATSSKTAKSGDKSNSTCDDAILARASLGLLLMTSIALATF